jgi:hypothetical protein
VSRTRICIASVFTRVSPGQRSGRGDRDCRYPTRGGVDLAMFAGARFHFNETIALTMRLGYPTSSVGVSFLF